MASIERVMAQEVVKIISELPEFLQFQKMLDLGGGPGLIGIAIVASHPNMRGVNFDLPPIVKIAETFITEYEMQDRIWVLGGDFNRDSIGEEYDLILASGCLQFAKDLDVVTKKIFDALNLGGVFVSIFPFGQTKDRTKPKTVVLNLLSTSLMGYETEFDQGQIADSMLRVGFSSVRSRTWNSSFGPMELDIARK
jgi:predicted TPR repeat methyltransferase